MWGFIRNILLASCLSAVLAAVPALAQENLDANKTPAQLYASDCAICHKTPQGLAKGGGIFGLAGFLQQHYTASREAAAAVAAYVQQMDKGPAAPAKRPAGKRTAKGGEKGKPGEAKPGEKPGEIKPAEAKANDSKPAEPKSAEPKSAEPKSTETKPAEPKSAESKPAESKPAEPKTDAAKSENKPAAKDEKKSD